MRDRRRSDTESAVLSELAAIRLLERASELDAARAAGIQLADLRAAATQAGISAGAFDAALEELDQANRPAVVEPEPARRTRRKARWPIVAAAAAVLAFTLFSVRIVPATAEPFVEQTFLLRCLSPGEARALIGPILSDGGAAYSPANAERVLVVRASQTQVDEVRSELERLEAPGSVACTVRPAGSTTR